MFATVSNLSQINPLCILSPCFKSVVFSPVLPSRRPVLLFLSCTFDVDRHISIFVGPPHCAICHDRKLPDCKEYMNIFVLYIHTHLYMGSICLVFKATSWMVAVRLLVGALIVSSPPCPDRFLSNGFRGLFPHLDKHTQVVTSDNELNRHVAMTFATIEVWFNFILYYLREN